MKERKKFKDTAVGKFLTEKIPDAIPAILDAVDDVIPGAKIITAIVGKRLSPEDQIKFDALLLEYEQNERKDYLADVQNAREMQANALAQDDVFSKRYIYYLASFVVISSTAMGVMLFFIDLPEHNRRLVEMFADIYLFGGAVMVLQFFFGSSYKKERPAVK